MHILNLAHLTPNTAALGPSPRFALWVQGCPFRCKGCIAPEWIPFEKANIVSAEALAKAIIGQEGIVGVTISGGEPMMQAGRLSRMLEMVGQERPALNVIVFTGFTREQLIWDEATDLLQHIDLLIDGQYVQQKNDGTGLRGSNNQQFHFLTDRLLPWQDEIVNHRPSLEFHILDDGVLMAGIPSADFKW